MTENRATLSLNSGIDASICALGDFDLEHAVTLQLTHERQVKPQQLWSKMRAMSQGEADTVRTRIEEVTLANEGFYQAFESLEIANMERIWATADYVTCIHPGWTLRMGWPAVRDSWVLIFNNTFSMTFELTELQVQVSEDMAWVICTENITSRQGEMSQESKIVATNLYERIGGRWLMIHHHGSPVMG